MEYDNKDDNNTDKINNSITLIQDRIKNLESFVDETGEYVIIDVMNTRNKYIKGARDQKIDEVIFLEKLKELLEREEI